MESPSNNGIALHRTTVINGNELTAVKNLDNPIMQQIFMWQDWSIRCASAFGAHDSRSFEELFKIILKGN